MFFFLKMILFRVSLLFFGILLFTYVTFADAAYFVRGCDTPPRSDVETSAVVSDIDRFIQRGVDVNVVVLRKVSPLSFLSFCLFFLFSLVLKRPCDVRVYRRPLAGPLRLTMLVSSARCSTATRCRTCQRARFVMCVCVYIFMCGVP